MDKSVGVKNIDEQGPPEYLVRVQEAVNSDRYDEAIEILEGALDEDSYNICQALGEIYLIKNEHEKAIEWFRKGEAHQDNYLDSIINTARVLVEMGKNSEAVDELLRGLRFKHTSTSAERLSAEFARTREYDKVCEGLKNHLEANPSRTVVMFMLAIVYSKHRKYDEAEHWYKEILKTFPNDVVYKHLSNLYNQQKKMSEAFEFGKKLFESDKDKPSHWINYCNCLMNIGRVEEGTEIFKQAIERFGNDKVPVTLLDIHYDPDLDPAELSRLHIANSNKLYTTDTIRRNHVRDTNPNRRLRVGYISGDFKAHSVAYFFESLLDGHSEDFEIYGYGNLPFRDHVTDRLERKFANYKDINGMGAKVIGNIIEGDKIDILVDLSGYTANGRQDVMALKPAPVQVTCIGYPDTTGLKTIDYRFTDEYADKKEYQEYYTEELVFLPGGFHCYKPIPSAPEVGELPAKKNGYVTFGSFNQQMKINASVVELWSEVLKSVKGSRLLLKFPAGNDEKVKDYYLGLFEKNGISRSRVDIYGPLTLEEHLKLYGQMDLSLDTFPYNGTTTTFEALWMGVGVISLVGDHHVSRVGYSILSNMGAAELAVFSKEDYIAKAVELASDIDRLAGLRSSLREQLAASSLCDEKGYAEKIEDAYRKMWKRWCSGEKTVFGLQKKLGEIGEKIKNGLIEEALDEFDTARTEYADIIENDPEKKLEIDKLKSKALNLYADRKFRVLKTHEAVEILKEAMRLDPDNTNLLFSLHYLPGADRDMIFREHVKWGKANYAPDAAKEYSNDRDPDKVLNIGYISPDFRRHPVASFFEPLLKEHDRNTIKVFGYGNVETPDEITERMKSRFDAWRNVWAAGKEEAAEMIRNDGIDILVDLAGHSSNNRLDVMADRPAPVQVTYLGYPDTTGIGAIDYRITDWFADPEGAEAFYTEKLLRLDGCFLSWAGTGKPAFSQTPARHNGFITFGSFNNLYKINDTVIEAWARILNKVENSILALKFSGGSKEDIRKIIINKFAAYGVAANRIRMSGTVDYDEHLRLYGCVDIALDTFPYNGTTTTCEALSMGVPVITLAGQNHVSRVGYSLLKNIGLEFFKTDTVDEYVSKAVAFASNIDAMEKIRQSIPQRMLAGGLADVKGFARRIENAYRQIWKNWIAENRVSQG